MMAARNVALIGLALCLTGAVGCSEDTGNGLDCRNEAERCSSGYVCQDTELGYDCVPADGLNNGNNGPANNGNNGNNGANNGPANNGANNGPANNGANNGPANNGPANNGANNGPANNGANNGPANNGGGCIENLVYAGQVHPDDDPISPNGGAPTTSNYTHDAGIDDLLAAVPGDGDADVNLVIRGATVSATAFNSPNQPVPRANRDFWLQDRNGAVKVFFFADDTANHAPFQVRVGQRIDVTVTRVTNFGGLPEITGVAARSWNLVEEGTQVYIDDRTGRRFVAGDVARLVRATGIVEGPAQECGIANCFQFHYGGAQPVTLRTSSDFVTPGACVTFVGPVALFEGQPQLDGANFDWLWVNN